MPPDPTSPWNTFSTFRSRLGFYLTGVAIGCMLLGCFWLAKRWAISKDNEEAARQQIAPIPAQPTTQPLTSPTTPTPK